MWQQGDEFVNNFTSAMPLFGRSWFERHRVTRKSVQRLVTLANDPDVGTTRPLWSLAMKISSPQLLMDALAAEIPLVLDELEAELILTQHLRRVLDF